MYRNQIIFVLLLSFNCFCKKNEPNENFSLSIPVRESVRMLKEAIESALISQNAFEALEEVPIFSGAEFGSKAIGKLPKGALFYPTAVGPLTILTQPKSVFHEGYRINRRLNVRSSGLRGWVENTEDVRPVERKYPFSDKVDYSTTKPPILAKLSMSPNGLIRIEEWELTGHGVLYCYSQYTNESCHSYAISGKKVIWHGERLELIDFLTNEEVLFHENYGEHETSFKYFAINIRTGKKARFFSLSASPYILGGEDIKEYQVCNPSHCFDFKHNKPLQSYVVMDMTDAKHPREISKIPYCKRMTIDRIYPDVALTCGQFRYLLENGEVKAQPKP